MGICIDVLIVDWGHLMAAPSDDQRYEMLHDASVSVDDDEDASQDRSPSTGPQWFWPSPPADGWFGKFDFGAVGFSYKDHFAAGEHWEAIRAFVAPAVRSAVDRFIDPLFWGGLEYMADRDNEGAAAHVSVVLPPAPSDHLLWCPPAAVSSLKLLWELVGAELEALREPFERYAQAESSRISGFDAFAGLLRGWGDVIGQAQQRGWGVVGIRC
ncbi:hypothetical protein K7395_24150 [Streptomyces filamentosus]|uniref:Uncharacterized protein n=2 Tax=Streptomyces filamentosus TaxID=67294 RepID=A0ABY4UZB0_STRFL|nr:hypothetical protein [Streptomyces filamentosus]EWS91779.1 hypothetical protein SSIG_02240 [Streptomyces filamentosus NRRL 11379]MYR78802.1 hypothetical protein [Streptomyces sp. SID5466]USC49590.1 hypothetical protein K7395_24150 [Streptomyces filamentosus]